MYELQTKEPQAGLSWGGDWSFECQRDAFTGARLLMDFFAPKEGCGVRILLSDTACAREADAIVAEWEPKLGDLCRFLWKGGAV